MSSMQIGHDNAMKALKDRCVTPSSAKRIPVIKRFLSPSTPSLSSSKQDKKCRNYSPRAPVVNRFLTPVKSTPTSNESQVEKTCRRELGFGK